MVRAKLQWPCGVQTRCLVPGCSDISYAVPTGGMRLLQCFHPVSAVKTPREARVASGPVHACCVTTRYAWGSCAARFQRQFRRWGRIWAPTKRSESLGHVSGIPARPLRWLAFLLIRFKSCWLFISKNQLKSEDWSSQLVCPMAASPRCTLWCMSF